MNFRILPCLLLLAITIISCHTEHKNKLVIATSSNMQFAMEELMEAFTSETSIPCAIILNSSGKLTAQINEGAPFDIFFSADLKFAAELFDSGLTTSSPKIYAYGSLVLWSWSDGITPSIELLATDRIKRIAIANPKTAPYGQASMSFLKNHKLLEEINDKIVFGESISQTNQFVISKAAEIGITAKSVVMAPALKNRGKWIDLGKEDYDPIPQSVIIIKREGGNLSWAEEFERFVFSNKGKNILEGYGYTFSL